MNKELEQDDVTQEEIQEVVVEDAGGVSGNADVCASEHPYILTEGGHTAYVGQNILVEQLNFFKFKVGLNYYISQIKDKKAVAFWSAYGLLRGQRSPIEDAIQKGFQLNYEALQVDCANFFENKDYKFAGNIESLYQLSQIKLIESRLLGLFEHEMQREKEAGSVAIESAITATTDFIYTMFASGLAQYSEIMGALTQETIFEKEEGTLRKKAVEVNKNEALTNYLSLPMELYHSMLLVIDECDMTEEQIDEFVKTVDNFIVDLSIGYKTYADIFRELVDNANIAQNNVSNEEQQYVPNPTRNKDDYSFG